MRGGQLPQLLSGPLVTTFSFGPAWASGGKPQTIALTPQIIKMYANQSDTTTFADGELFLGVQRNFNEQVNWQMGLAVAKTSNVNLSGVVWDDASSLFENYHYQYNINHTHLALQGKLISTPRPVMPYLNVGIGVAWNNASNFTSTPLLFEAVPTPGFSGHTTTSFTYTIGVGIQHQFGTHLQTGLGYEFSDWGNSHLGRASGQTQGKGLALSHLYTNGLMFNITYLS